MIESQRKRITALFIFGKSSTQIAEDLGISLAEVLEVLAEKGRRNGHKGTATRNRRKLARRLIDEVFGASQ